jgi:hypothetical protein
MWWHIVSDVATSCTPVLVRLLYRWCSWDRDLLKFKFNLKNVELRMNEWMAHLFFRINGISLYLGRTYAVLCRANKWEMLEYCHILFLYSLQIKSKKKKEKIHSQLKIKRFSSNVSVLDDESHATIIASLLRVCHFHETWNFTFNINLINHHILSNVFHSFLLERTKFLMFSLKFN